MSEKIGHKSNLDETQKQRVNVYSDREGKFMEWSQTLRGHILNPL